MALLPCFSHSSRRRQDADGGETRRSQKVSAKLCRSCRITDVTDLLPPLFLPKISTHSIRILPTLSKSKSSLSLGATSTLYPHCDLYPSSTREMLLAPGAPLPGV